jgi:hypothetical protein
MRPIDAVESAAGCSKQRRERRTDLGILYSAVDTMEFQARGFYEKQGYTVYGIMEDYPYGYRKFLLRKTLS